MVRLKGGGTLSRELPNVVAAGLDQVRERFRAAASAAVGEDATRAIEEAIRAPDAASSVATLMRLTRTAA